MGRQADGWIEPIISDPFIYIHESKQAFYRNYRPVSILPNL